LIDLFVPLNDDITKEKRRELAKKQSYIKYLGTWSFIDTMMVSNAFPDKKLQLASAKSMIDNSMVIDGKIVNIRQHLRAKDRTRYTTMSQDQRRELEKSFEKRVSDLKESSSLSKVAKIENDQVVIPGVSDEELAKFRTTVVEYGRKLSGQMSQDNKADYRRDTILRSFMMFKNWIPKMVYTRAGDLRKDMEIGEWEYGRARLFIKTWASLGLRNVFQMRDIILGTDKGLQLMNEMLEAKRQEHFNKTGQELTITNEEFYDLVRKNLSNQMKELGALLSLFGLIIAARAAKPDDDDDELEKNRYKFWAKLVNKTTDELSFYYDPRSFISMTNGSVLPSLSLLDKSEKLIEHAVKQGYGYYSKDEQLMEKAHPTKYFLNLLPGLSQIQNDYLPYIDAELAKSLGVRVTEQSRMTR
jgi:hypothetical protein